MKLQIDFTNVPDVDNEIERMKTELYDAHLTMEMPDWWMSVPEKLMSLDQCEYIARHIALLDQPSEKEYD